MRDEREQTPRLLEPGCPILARIDAEIGAPKSYAEDVRILDWAMRKLTEMHREPIRLCPPLAPPFDEDARDAIPVCCITNQPAGEGTVLCTCVACTASRHR